MSGPAGDPAFPRWLALQGVRLGGTVLVLLGILIEAGRLAPAAGIPEWVGLVVAVAGMAAVFVLPRLLARRWKSPER